MSREDRIIELKQRMVAKYGSCLLPIAEDTATFPEFRKDDTPEEREIKLQKKRDIIAAREALYKQKVPEMMVELEKLIDRVKSARPELVKSGMENIYSTGTAALTVFNLACDQCGNRDPNYLVTDNRRGDRICLGKDGRGCGAVVQDHIEVQGADRRNFEGEDDRRQFGPAPNKLLGDAANMETSLNIEMKGTGRENAPWKRISQAHQNVEMSLSNVGKDEKHTREGYKTAHKRRAFAQLEVIASDMNIHMQVVQKAKEEFAKYREVREALHNFEGVLLACLALAFEELSPHLQFMSEKPKFTTIAETELNDVSFGKVRPRQEVTEDIAICAVPSVAMGRFTLEQVKEWLVCVSTDSNNSGGDSSEGSRVSYEKEAMVVYEYIAKLCNNTTTAASTASVSSTTAGAKSKVELPKSSIFGTVTVSSRLKMYGNKGTSNGSSTSNGKSNEVVLRAGQHLLRVNNIAAALHAMQDTTDGTNSASNSISSNSSAQTDATTKAAELLLREAVIRRSQYDATLLEYERIISLQNTRMRIEDQTSTNFQASVLQLGKNKPTPTANVKVENSSSRDSTSNNNTTNSEKRTLSTDDSNGHATKRIKTEPATSNNNSTTTTISPEEVTDFADFDLEDLVGGPVASANESKYANIKTVPSTNTVNGSSSTNSSRPVAHKVPPSVHSSVSSGVTIKQEGDSSQAAAQSATAETKKVGSRPRPKFVIS